MVKGERWRRTMRRRYLFLGIGELAAASVFATVAVLTIEPRLTERKDLLALWSALIPLLAILLQAGAYWLLARIWVGRTKMPVVLAKAYCALGHADIALLVVGLVLILTLRPEIPGLVLLVIAIWLFGVIEYVNYFVVRLAYPITGWLRTVVEWRTPRLVQDMRSARPAAGGSEHI